MNPDEVFALALDRIDGETRRIVLDQRDAIVVATQAAAQMLMTTPVQRTPMTDDRRALVALVVRSALGVAWAAVADGVRQGQDRVVSAVVDGLTIAYDLTGRTVGARVRPQVAQLVEGIEQTVEERARTIRTSKAAIETIVGGMVQRAMAGVLRLLDGAKANRIGERQVVEDLATLLLGQDPVYDAYGLERPDLTPVRFATVNGIPLVVSEAFNAERIATAEMFHRVGLIDLGKWTLSPSHAGLKSSPDICDEYASRNIGFGPGWYRVRAWPAAPHPHCGCRMGQVRTGSVAAWVAALP